MAKVACHECRCRKEESHIADSGEKIDTYYCELEGPDQGTAYDVTMYVDVEDCPLFEKQKSQAVLCPHCLIEQHDPVEMLVDNVTHPSRYGCPKCDALLHGMAEVTRDYQTLLMDAVVNELSASTQQEKAA